MRFLLSSVLRENSKVDYDPINNYRDDDEENEKSNSTDNNDTGDDELFIDSPNILNINNNSNNRLQSSSPLTLRTIKTPSNFEQEDYYENEFCPPSESSSSQSLHQYPNNNYKTQKNKRSLKMSTSFEMSVLEGTSNKGGGVGDNARYSRMSQEEGAGGYQRKGGKLQNLLGGKQCNPFAMFVALTILFIIMGALALVVLVMCFVLIESPEPIVILVSIDAFRYDFVDKFTVYMPALASLRKQGVVAGKLQPCFPTKTFPNHYSIATGQYVENHGIVSNTFYDRNAPFTDKLFKQPLTDPYWWSEGEPIWITAEKQNVSTVTYDYPGGNVKIQGIYPSFYQPDYKKDNTIDKRIEKLEQYLKMKKNKVPGAPSLMMYYLNWVDSAAHHYGVPDTADSTSSDSLVFYNALKLTDSFIGAVMKKIEELDMKSNVNFIIVSDHGMLNLSPDRTIWIQTMLEKYYNETQPVNKLDLTSVVTSHTVGTIVDFNVLVDSTDDTLRSNTINQLYTDLQETIKRYSLNCTLHKREDIPANYHYSNNVRIPDIILVSDPGYYSGLTSSAWWGERGDHGYRNDIDEMYAFFAGIGPKLKSGGIKAYEVVQNIHIHALIAELLKIKPSPRSDGNIDNIKNVLSYELKRIKH